jgi:hypothetical protein
MLRKVLEKISRPQPDNLGYHRLKNNKALFDDECSKLMTNKKQAKSQWLQNPSQINGDNLQN